MLAAHDRSQSTHWEGNHGLVLPEVDPSDETAFEAVRETQPERRLLLAILTDAIVRCRRLASAPRYAAIELREAERWIKSDDRAWPCSFVNVCEALDIAYAPLRRAVLAWRRTPSKAHVTRRALLVKSRRHRRSAAVAAACASADAAEAGSAAPASSAESSLSSSPTPACSQPTVASA